MFDYAFGPENGNRQVYDKTAKLLIPGVLSGHNGTVFAYGATGSGKTHTMVGSAADPGMMVLSLKDVFDGTCCVYQIQAHCFCRPSVTSTAVIKWRYGIHLKCTVLSLSW